MGDEQHRFDEWDEPTSAHGLRLLAATVVLHPDLRRVGDVWYVADATASNSGRLEPTTTKFGAPGSSETRPLAAPFVMSWRVARVEEGADGGATLSSEGWVRVDGEPFSGRGVLSAARLDRGVVLQIASNVVVLLHRRLASGSVSHDRFGLSGDSDSIEQVRRDIARVADLDVPVLLLGETGVGKELVASAIHEASPRAEARFVAVNMAALPRDLAASELFGHERGAFTGAVSRRTGHFRSASKGTLFLDELGDTAMDIQVMLLRALETSQVWPVGAARPVRVDARLIAATDRDLDTMTHSGRFRSALLHRLMGYSIRIASLRERRDDVARLFVSFLREFLDELGMAPLADRPRLGDRALISGIFITRLLLCDWPGNVRQLRNVVREVVIRSRDQATLVCGPLDLVDTIKAQPPAAAPAPDRRTNTRPARAAGLRDEELIAALKEHRWRIGPTAKALGVPKSSLYGRIDRCKLLRKASELTETELRDLYESTDGNLEAMADAARVSPRGIKLRLSELNIG